MRRRNQSLWERITGPSSISYRDELARRRKQAKKDARLAQMREREAEREQMRREREQIREANKLKRQLLKEEAAERRAEAAEREQERASQAIPSRAAIERAYAAGAKTLSEAMEMARGNPGRKKETFVRIPGAATGRPELADRPFRGGKMQKLGRAYRTMYTSRNPRGTKGKFQRCVEAVEARGGAYDPNAVCAAQERRKYGQKELTRRAVAGKRAKSGKRANPTDKQVNYALYLLDQAGYSTKWMNSSFKELGATMRERSGSVDTWLRRLTGPEISRLIDRLKARTNPADAAMAVSEEFHGRKVKAMIPVQSKRHYHKYLAELGELRKLVVQSSDGKHRVTLTNFDGAMLCCNEGKNQLFVVGGDQSVDLGDFGIRNPHETETLGEVLKIEYFTDKEHLGEEGGTALYVHKFRSTNDNGKHVTVRTARNPELIYHMRDERLEFSGGSYEIRAEGIDL